MEKPAEAGYVLLMLVFFQRVVAAICWLIIGYRYLLLIFLALFLIGFGNDLIRGRYSHQLPGEGAGALLVQPASLER